MIDLIRNGVLPVSLVWGGVVVFGLAVGSFVNVLIWRLPRHESIRVPASHCPSCGRPLKWYHNVPVVSWLALRGRCAYCRSRISWIYPVVELATAGLFLAFFRRYGPTPATLGFWYLSVTLIAVVFIDWRHRIIPNRLTYPAVIVGLAVSWLSPHIAWSDSLAGAFVGFAGFLGIAYLGRLMFKKDSLGGGDIKLAAVLGAFLGIGKVILVVLLSAAIGLAVSGIAMIFSQALRRDRVIPYGPFLAIAALVAGYWGDAILRFYIQTVIH